MTYQERCKLAQDCLPDAPYRTMLTALHTDMQDEIDRLTERTTGQLDIRKYAEKLQSLVCKLHAAKGRYHTQLAACDLFDAVGLKNERPVK